MTEDAAGNRAALRRFYEKKDPSRVKNVEPLFLRFEEHDILAFVEQKYREPVEGWVSVSHLGSDGDSPSPSPSPVAAAESKPSLFAASTLLRRSFKSSTAANKKGTLVEKTLEKNTANSYSLANMVVSNTNSDSEDEDEEGEKKPLETRIHLHASPSPSPKASPTTTLEEKVPTPPQTPRMTPDEVNAKIAEITKREKEALDFARGEEAKIKERQLKAKEAIAKAMQELAEKEKELEEVKRQMEVEKKRDANVKERRQTMNLFATLGNNTALTELRLEAAIAEGDEPVSVSPSVLASTEEGRAKEEEALRREEEDVKRKEVELANKAKLAEDGKLAVIKRVQEAESEALLLMVKENEILRTEVAISNRLQQVDELNAPVENVAVEEEEHVVVVEDEEQVMELPSLISESNNKRMTRYERKLQEALTAEPAKPKGLMGNLLGRMTVSGKKKPEQSQLAAMVEEDEVVVATTALEEDLPSAVSLTAPAQSVIAEPAAVVVPGLPVPGTVEYTKFLEFQRFQQQQFQAFQEQQSKPVVPVAPPINFIPDALKGQVNDLMDENAKLKQELQEAKLLAENQRLKRELEDAKRAAMPQPVPQVVYVQQQQQQPVIAAPVAVAPAGAVGEPVDDGSGFKRYPAGHPDLDKYKRMQKSGLPQGPVENAMMRDFVHPASLYGENALNNPKPKPGAAIPTKPPAAAAVVAPSSGGATPVPGEFRKLTPDHPDMEKYRKMQKSGLPQGPVENAMMRDFIHPASLYGANAMNDPKPKPVAVVAKPAAASTASGGGDGEYRKLTPDHPDMEKYRKMQKSGLPQGPVENAMMRDFIHPASLYGANAMNDPKPKPGLKAAPKPAPVAAPVAVAAPANGKPPPGMSMMEEMKWKQAQKAKEGPKAPVVIKPVEKPVTAAAPAAMKLGDKPPPGMSMMEEMKWKQAQKKLKEEEDAKNGVAPKPVMGTFQKSSPAAAAATPNFKVGLKSTGNSVLPKSNAAPATPSWQKAPTKAVIQTATNLAAAAPAANLDALIALFVGAKISPDNAKKYATALAAEGFDAPEKLALVDDADLAACGITTRFDIKIINSLKTTVPKVAAAPTVSPAAAKPTYSSTPKSGPTLPTYGQNQPIKPNFVINKPAVPAPVAAAPATNKPNFVINKPAVAAPAPVVAAANKPNFVINKPATAGVGASSLKPSPVAASTPGRPVLKSSADAQKEKDAQRLAFVMSLGAPLDSYKKPKQIG